MSQSRSTMLAAALATALALAMTACAAPADEESSPVTESSSPSATPTPSETASPDAPTSEPTPTPTETAPAGPAMTIKISGDTVKPNAEEINLGIGEPLLMTITSDRAGQLHVHSKPEQFVDFKAGTSKHELVIKTPGVVEAEEHDTSAVVAVITVK